MGASAIVVTMNISRVRGHVFSKSNLDTISAPKYTERKHLNP